jgi:hypothetical protein
MQTTIDLNSTTTGQTATLLITTDPVTVPNAGDEISAPSPIAAPVAGQYQQVTISNRILRYTTDAAGNPQTFVLLVTANPLV